MWLHPKDGERMARKPEVESFLARLEASLVDKNYQTDEHRRELVFRSIRNIFKRVQPFFFIFLFFNINILSFMHGSYTFLLPCIIIFNYFILNPFMFILYTLNTIWIFFYNVPIIFHTRRHWHQKMWDYFMELSLPFPCLLEGQATVI